MAGCVDSRIVTVRPRFFRSPAATEAPITGGPSVSFKLLIAFLLMFYSSVALVFPSLDAYRPALVVALAASFMLVVELALARQAFRITWPQGYVLLGFLGTAVVSSFSAFYARHAFNTTADLAKIVVIYVLIENLVTSETRLRRLMLTMVIGGLFPAIGTITYYVRGILIEGRGAWQGIFKNPNENAYALAILVPLAAALAVHSRAWLRIALGGAIGSYVLAVFLTFSRGGLLGLLVILGLMGWRQHSSAVRIAMAVILGGGLVLAGMFWARKQDFGDIRRDTTFNQRIATIKAGTLMFMDRPLFGVGPGNSLVAYPLYVPKEAHCGCQTQLVIHNSFLQVLSEMGALGFLPWVVFIGAGIVHARRLQKSPDRVYPAALEIALWGYVVCSLSGGYGYSWFPYLLVGLVAGAKRIAEGEETAGARLHNRCRV